MTIKKIFKIISINILVLILFILVFDIICYLRNISEIPYGKKISSFFEFYTPYTVEKLITTPGELRPIVQMTSVKKPILLFGCSFTFGTGLKNEETLGFQLSKYTDRVVYNYGIPGSSPKEMLFLLRHKELIPINIKPEYVIFVYIGDHVKRLYMSGWPDSNYLMPDFKKTKNNTLTEKKSAEFFKNLRIIRIFKLYNSLRQQYSKESTDLLNLYFTECNNEIKKQYPNTKLVILIYNENGNENWKVLENNGITVINLSDLINKNINSTEFRISEKDLHPNSKAWKTIIPALSEKLGL